MAYNTKQIVKDVDGNPISQYYNPVTDKYEPVEGSNGGNKVVVENNQGLSLIPILDKLSQLTGTVIDEETRKSNELQRIVFFEMLQQMLEDGELKGEQGIQGFTGDGLEFTWRGTELGVRIEGEVEYIYVNLKGEKGDTGDIESLNSQHITDALGYTPANATNEHTHTNKSTIDKFSEVEGKPFYNGEEIGGAVPNLTLTELTLGNFKILFNEVENSLDFEVIE